MTREETQKKVSEYLTKIDEVIAKGKFKDNWESLSAYEEPKWYKNAKFGIFIHWGVYSVPAAIHSDWYARNMYVQGSEEYEHHVKTYGDPKDFPYENFIPMFKAEKFDPKEWIQLFKDAGAKYFMPVAEHHDGFQMYESELSKWNAVEMGPKKNILQMLKEEGEKEGLVFCASSHRAENYWFFAPGRTFDSGIQDIEYQEPYGAGDPAFTGDQTKQTKSIYGPQATKEHLDNWLARTCEIIDKYQPKVLWFDWWIHNLGFKPYLKKLAAYYYNRAIEWGEEVAINYKVDAFARGTAIFDVERGQLSEIRPQLWQTDTAVAKNSWGYIEGNDYKTPESLVSDMLDIVSKNGCLLLNIGPKADGTIPDEDQKILRSIGAWLKVNGEGVYDTTYWSTYGEGPTEIVEGTFCDVARDEYTAEDIRFTFKAPYIYAFALKWPKTNKVKIKKLASYLGKNGNKYFKGHIENIEILGFNNKFTYSQDDDALNIQVEGDLNTTYPVCFKIKID